MIKSILHWNRSLFLTFVFLCLYFSKVVSATISDGNLAYQKTVTVLGPNSNTNNFSKSPNNLLNLTDGNVSFNNTLWTNTGTTVAADGSTGAFIVDLGASTTFNRFKFFRQGDGYRALPFDYQIIYSDTKPTALSDLSNTSIYKVMSSGTVAGHLGESTVTLDLDDYAQSAVTGRYVILYVKNMTLINSKTTYYFIGTEIEIYNSFTTNINYATAAQGAGFMPCSVTDATEQTKLLAGKTYIATNGAKDNGVGTNRFLTLQLGQNGQYISELRFSTDVNTTASVYYSNATVCPLAEDIASWTLLGANQTALAIQNIKSEIVPAKFINIQYSGVSAGVNRYINQCVVYGPDASTLDRAIVSQVADKLTVNAILGKNTTLSAILFDMNLYTNGDCNTPVSWVSSKPDVISNAGVVTRQSTDQTLTLTATIARGTATPVQKIFTVTVLNNAMTENQIVDRDFDALTNELVLNGNSALNNVLTKLNLPVVGIYSSAISWQVDATGVVDVNTGAVTQNNFADKTVTLTATLTKGATSRTKSFTITVKQFPFVEQSGDNPVLMDAIVSKPKDNIVFLMAAASRHSQGLTVFTSVPKHFWIDNFGKNANDYLEWKVNVSEAGVYHVDALLSATTAQSLKLYVAETAQSLIFTPAISGWNKIDAGTISLPAGTSTLRLAKNSTDLTAIVIKSLELVRESDRAAYLNRISQFKANSTDLSKSKYGLMFQYGVWGYPKTGAAKSMEDATNSFDVPKFVQMVKSTGAKYIIWSATWYQYRMQAPIQALDSIMGAKTLTTTRDLIGEVAAALKTEGIGFYLYYHSGLNQEPTWLAKQNWPANNQFSYTCTGNRTTFFNNWMSVVKCLGNRYGTNLDGWFFDDGCNYYPAPFETLGEAARAGNPNRLISWNPWSGCRFTDFQDVQMGEGSHGEVATGSGAVGGNGVFTSGPQKGLLQHAMFVTEQDWGVHNANTVISTKITSQQAINWVTSASARNVPLSFDIMMWEDGSVSDSTLNVMKTLRKTFYPSMGINNIMIDNNGRIKLSPSLVTNQTTLLMPNDRGGEFKISVYDMFGRVVFLRNISVSDNKVCLDLSALSSGVYNLRMEGAKSYECKFIKQ